MNSREHERGHSEQGFLDEVTIDPMWESQERKKSRMTLRFPALGTGLLGKLY